MKSKILIIEDDPSILSQLSHLLTANGYEAAAVTDFTKIMEQTRSFTPDLILLDIRLPGNDGFAVCSQIRSFCDSPVIFVTACSTDMDELSSILSGGDAFITKPYNTAILLARINALLRRSRTQRQPEMLSWSGAVLHPECSQLTYDGKTADLTKNELKILYYLFTHAGKICSRSDIVDFLWDQQIYVDDNALSVNITRIRSKLKMLGLTDFILTKHRQGYLI